MEIVVNAFRKFFNALLYIATFLYMFATVVTAANVFGRYVLRHSIFGSEELSNYAVLTMSFFMFAIIESRGHHLSIELLTSKIKSEKFKTAHRVFKGVVNSCIFGILFYYGIKVTSTAIKYSSASPTLQIPKGIVYGITTASFLVAILAWICIIFFNKRRMF